MNRVCLSLIWFIISMLHHPLTVRIEANDEGVALIAFKQAITDDPFDSLGSWNPNLINPCTWFHVTCDESYSYVISVDLGNYNLSGHLVPELGNLKNLVNLDLFKNNLTGPIPEALGDLKNLTDLRLNDNNLSGCIPVQALLNISKRGFEDGRGDGVDISNNPQLCSNYTDPPCLCPP